MILALPKVTRARTRGGGQFHAARREGRGRGVFDAKLDGLGQVFTRDFGRQGQCEIDARRNAAAGHDVAVLRHAVG